MVDRFQLVARQYEIKTQNKGCMDIEVLRRRSQD
jgi:hypothetical protein